MIDVDTIAMLFFFLATFGTGGFVFWWVMK